MHINSLTIYPTFNLLLLSMKRLCLQLKKNFIFLSFFLIALIGLQSKCLSQQFNKPVYYKIMANGDASAVDKEIKKVESASGINKEAYKGALLMKKAGLVGGPGKKLKLFKEGHENLESAIKRDNKNVEFRLLRLIIQEHAPGILNYKDNIDKDGDYVHLNFKSLSPEVQQAVIDYRKHSDKLQSLQF